MAYKNYFRGYENGHRKDDSKNRAIIYIQIVHCKHASQYGFIRNGLIRNTTEIFRIFKERLLKILEIRNKFFYGKEIKERAMKNYQFSSKTSDFF